MCALDLTSSHNFTPGMCRVDQAPRSTAPSASSAVRWAAVMPVKPVMLSRS